MTLTFSAEDASSGTLIRETMEHFDDAARALHAAIREIKAGRYDKAREAATSVRDLRQAFQLAMEERTRVERLGRQGGGAERDPALDLAAARDEIGRRLACLRDAGGD